MAGDLPGQMKLTGNFQITQLHIGAARPQQFHQSGQTDARPSECGGRVARKRRRATRVHTS